MKLFMKILPWFLCAVLLLVAMVSDVRRMEAERRMSDVAFREDNAKLQALGEMEYRIQEVKKWQAQLFVLLAYPRPAGECGFGKEQKEFKEAQRQFDTAMYRLMRLDLGDEQKTMNKVKADWIRYDAITFKLLKYAYTVDACDLGEMERHSAAIDANTLMRNTDVFLIPGDISKNLAEARESIGERLNEEYAKRAPRGKRAYYKFMSFLVEVIVPGMADDN